VSIGFLAHHKSDAIPPSFSDEFEKFFEPSVSAIVRDIETIATGIDPSKTVRIQFSF
jgi:hypothetical protein